MKVEENINENGGSKKNEVENKIGKKIEGKMVEDGENIKMGIGKINDDVMEEIKNKKEIGIN